MSETSTIADAAAFAERLRLQLAARYPALTLEADEARPAVRVSGPGVDARLDLAALHDACLRHPERSAALIADFVARSERSLLPHEPGDIDPDRLMWCVRTQSYLARHSRDADLVVREVAADLVAFLSERLPGSAMRGVPREDWSVLGEERAVAAADEQTRRRFAGLPRRIRDAARVPPDGWQFSGESLFQGSMLLVEDVLAALVERSGGPVLLALPDRAIVHALPESSPNAATFDRRVRRCFRDSFNPGSDRVLRTEGLGLEAAGPSRADRQPSLLRRLFG